MQTKDDLFLNIELYPNNSLNKLIIFFLFFLFSTILFLSCYFASLGAWPVSGFLGLDIILFLWAIKVNYNKTKKYEKILLGKNLIIYKFFSNKVESKLCIEPTWIKIKIISVNNKNHIELSSRGKSISIGNFLKKEELLSFAEELRAALIIREKSIFNH